MLCLVWYDPVAWSSTVGRRIFRLCISLSRPYAFQFNQEIFDLTEELKLCRRDGCKLSLFNLNAILSTLQSECGNVLQHFINGEQKSMGS